MPEQKVFAAFAKARGIAQYLPGAEESEAKVKTRKGPARKRTPTHRRDPMRNLASTMFTTCALAICAPGMSLALPLTGGIDRAIAAAPASGRPLAVQDQPRRSRADANRAYAHDKAHHAHGYYPSAYYVPSGYPYYYPGLGYPYYYAGYYWPHYYGRFRYPGYEYSPFAFFGFNPSDFPP